MLQQSARQFQTRGSVLKDLRLQQERLPPKPKALTQNDKTLRYRPKSLSQEPKRLPTEPKILRSKPKDWGREPKR